MLLNPKPKYYKIPAYAKALADRQNKSKIPNSKQDIESLEF